MRDFNAIKKLALETLDWIEQTGVYKEGVSNRTIAYQLSHKLESLYGISGIDPFYDNEKISAMASALLKGRHVVHSTNRVGDYEAALVITLVVVGLRELIRIVDHGAAVTVSQPKIPEHSANLTEQVISVELEKASREHLPLINLYSTKGPSIPETGDFDGDSIKGYWLTLTTPIKRGPGKGRIRTLKRLVVIIS